MADTSDKVQVNVLLTHEADKLLEALHGKEQDAAASIGERLSLSAYVERLVRQEAKRQGVKPKKR